MAHPGFAALPAIKVIKIIATALLDEHLFNLKRGTKSGAPARSSGGYTLNAKGQPHSAFIGTETVSLEPDEIGSLEVIDAIGAPVTACPCTSLTGDCSTRLRDLRATLSICLTPTSRNFTAFGLQKAAIYAGAAVSFSTFNVASLTAPITNADQPMIFSPFSFFLAAVPGTAYRLFRLTNSGGPGATLTLQATISSSFKAPTREANQPGTSSTVDSSDDEILASPYFDSMRRKSPG